MFLSRLTLDPRHEGAARDLAVPYDLHRTLATAFGEAPDGLHRSTHGILFRVDDAATGPTVLAQSVTVPDWSRLPHGYARRVDGPKPVSLALANGQHLRFRLVANPVRRVRPDGRKHPQRLALIHDRAGNGRPDGFLDWLERQARAAGFAVLEVEHTPFRLHARRPLGQGLDKSRVPHFGVRFDGLLQVSDAEALEKAVRKGIGAAKSFGFGLLSLAPA